MDATATSDFYEAEIDYLRKKVFCFEQALSLITEIQPTVGHSISNLVDSIETWTLDINEKKG